MLAILAAGGGWLGRIEPALARLASTQARCESMQEKTMSHSGIFRTSAALMAAFGLFLQFAPNTLVALYKAPEMNAPGVYNSMLYGGLLIAMAVMNWSASGMPLREVRPIVLGNLVGSVLGLLTTLYRLLTVPDVPPTAWLNVGIFLVFSLLFAHLLLRVHAQGEMRGGARSA